MPQRRIDRETVDRILSTADIVEVVSDFVRLKKRGANYIGLCPFHNERTPSFSVSKAKGICKCFSCGKGGSAIGFIMEHESMSYNEALRYLARKYNIEIKETEISAEEQKADVERESMLEVNEFAMKRFQHYLNQTEDGRNIALAYFRERGVNDKMIERFRLGYDPEGKDLLAQDAIEAGFKEKYLLETGLCFSRERTGTLVDRFKGRVIFPIISISGKIVAFGGRTMRSDKNIAKYINSPESIIYSKSRELYGFYQAKPALVKKGYVILVEGYMDVISMSQAGVENVVASSGTSLTEGQIRLLHRFTDNVTLMYDSDPAGIKASLRGIDMLLSEGLDISIVLLPDGDDPDSFAQVRTSSEVEDYVTSKAEDFIRFKTRILLGEAGEEPLKRARVIQEVAQSIAVIPDDIKRAVYSQECSRLLDISEKILKHHIVAYRLKKAEIRENNYKKDSTYQSISSEFENTVLSKESIKDHSLKKIEEPNINSRLLLSDYEKVVLRYIVRYGCLFAYDYIDDKTGDSKAVNILEFIENDIKADEINFHDPVNEKLFIESLKYLSTWQHDLNDFINEAKQRKDQAFKSGIEIIKREAKDLNEITSKEEMLKEQIEMNFMKEIHDFTLNYMHKKLTSCEQDDIRKLATDLVTEKHRLSKYHTRFAEVSSEEDRLIDLVSQALNAWKLAILSERESDIMIQLEKAVIEGDTILIENLLKEKQRIYDDKKEFGRLLGERVVNPPRK